MAGKALVSLGGKVMAKYLISYNIENFRNRLIVIWAKDKNEAKKMLNFEKNSICIILVYNQ